MINFKRLPLVLAAVLLVVFAMPIGVRAASYSFGPYGFTGTITHTYQNDFTDSSTGPIDDYHATASLVVTVAADGSATVASTWHSTEVITSTVTCFNGATETGHYSRIDTNTIDGTGTGTLAAGKVRVSGSGTSYSLSDVLDSSSDSVPIAKTRVITYSGGNGACPPPAGSTITSSDSLFISYDDTVTMPLSDPNVAVFSGSTTHLDADDANVTIGTSWNLQGCGEPPGKQWAQRFALPYKNEKDALAQLSSTFGSKVQKFIKTLRNGGATVNVNTTYRPQSRAYLMANAWAIANGKDATTVVAYPGTDKAGKPVSSDGALVPICWIARNTTGAKDDTRTTVLASEMVSAFGIDGAAGYPSEHMKRTAVDLSISWKGVLSILQGPIVPKGTKRVAVRITSGKRDGTNTALWGIGATYGIIKGPRGSNSKGKDLRTVDTVHWSADGK